MVILSFAKEYPDPKDLSTMHTNSGWTCFRVESGKIAEH